MKLEQQVCSLELAKKLKELGVKQESHFKWSVAHPEIADTKDDELSLKGIQPQLTDADWATDDGKLEDIAAFTVAELGKILPRQICDNDQPLSGQNGKCYTLVIDTLADDYSSGKKIDGWRLRYDDTKAKVDSDHKLSSTGIYYVGTEADARAKMLIYLIENKFITV